MNFPISSPPVTTLKTPGGSRSRHSSASHSRHNGVQGDGFTTMQLPVLKAGAIFQIARDTGKFQGTMAPTTPSGSWNVMSTPPATGMV